MGAKEGQSSKVISKTASRDPWSVPLPLIQPIKVSTFSFLSQIHKAVSPPPIICCLSLGRNREQIQIQVFPFVNEGFSKKQRYTQEAADLTDDTLSSRYSL